MRLTSKGSFTKTDETASERDIKQTRHILFGVYLITECIGTD